MVNIAFLHSGSINTCGQFICGHGSRLPVQTSNTEQVAVYDYDRIYSELVRILRTGSYTQNWFVYSELVRILRTGSYTQNWVVYSELVRILRTGLVDSV